MTVTKDLYNIILQFIQINSVDLEYVNKYHIIIRSVYVGYISVQNSLSKSKICKCLPEQDSQPQRVCSNVGPTINGNHAREITPLHRNQKSICPARKTVTRTASSASLNDNWARRAPPLNLKPTLPPCCTELFYQAGVPCHKTQSGPIFLGGKGDG